MRDKLKNEILARMQNLGKSDKEQLNNVITMVLNDYEIRSKSTGKLEGLSGQQGRR